MARNERLFALAALLRGRRILTANYLAARLSVSVRTLYRDIEALRLMGVPITGEPGIGYRLAAEAELPAVAFTRAELEALALGARMVATWADPALADAARSAVARVEAVLPDPLKQMLLNTPLYANDFLATLPPPDLGLVREATVAGNILSFVYEDKNGEHTQRVVRPLALHFWRNTWTLAAWCELRNDFRTFRIDRLRNVNVGAAFEAEPGKSFDDFMAHVRREINTQR